MRQKTFGPALVLAAILATGMALVHASSDGTVIPKLSAAPTEVVSTIPANGDVNPYGVSFVPRGFPKGGLLSPGDILVSNFNNGGNLQGTGTTIVRIDAVGQQTLFFHGQPGLGLTTALGVLRAGFVLVGSLPTTTPTASCTEGPSGQETGVGAGGLLILDSHGHVVRTLQSTAFLNGPWDLTLRDAGAAAQVYVSNALDGSVTRLDLAVDRDRDRVEITKTTRIASGYTRRCDPAALVVGPTGLALDADADLLYVASTGDNAIYAVRNASRATADHGPGTVVVRDDAHLHGPLALVRARNGDLITSQGDAINPDANHPSEIVEYRPSGQFVAEFSVDSAPGSAFGMALRTSEDGFTFAAVDDGTNTLDIWVVRMQEAESDRAPETKSAERNERVAR